MILPVHIDVLKETYETSHRQNFSAWMVSLLSLLGLKNYDHHFFSEFVRSMDTRTKAKNKKQNEIRAMKTCQGG